MPITPPLIDIVDASTFNAWSQQSTDELNLANDNIVDLQTRIAVLEATVISLTTRIVALETVETTP